MSSSPDLAPVWHLDRGRMLFAGPLRRNAPHRHSTAVLLTGLYDSFALRIDGAAWTRCRTAVIPAGIAYEFDMQGAPLAVLYAEPQIAGAENLARFVRETYEVEGALIGQGGETKPWLEMFEDRASPSWIAHGLDDLLGFATQRARRLDPRVARLVARLQHDHGGLSRIGVAAAALGLSPSRLQHLFTQQIGVPFRRYRCWCRMRAAIGEAIGGSSLTAAAHAAGFADQAHFARAFRAMFGAPASASLSVVRRVGS